MSPLVGNQPTGVGAKGEEPFAWLEISSRRTAVIAICPLVPKEKADEAARKKAPSEEVASAGSYRQTPVWVPYDDFFAHSLDTSRPIRKPAPAASPTATNGCASM